MRRGRQGSRLPAVERTVKKETAAEAAAARKYFETSGLEVYRRLLATLSLDFVADLLALVEAV